MIRSASVVFALVVGVSGVVAQSSDPVAARNELMKAQGAQLYGVINGMIRGQAPYDQARVDAAFVILERTAKESTPLYAVNSVQPAPNSQFRPSPKIWETKKDFDDRFVDLIKVLGEQKSKAKSLEDLRGVFTAVNKVCTDCHEGYRVRN